MNKIKLAVIVPVYNEAVKLKNNLSKIYQSIVKYPDVSLIVVNDGSIDNSFNIIHDLSKKYKRLDYVNLVANQGYGKAIRQGYIYAKKKKFTHVLFMDSDLTNCPSDIKKFYKLCLQGYDFIKASRFESNGRMSGVPFIRKFQSKIASIITKFLFKSPLTDPTNGFRAFKVNIINYEKLTSNDFSIIVEELYYFHLRKSIKYYNLPVILTNREENLKKSSFEYNLKTYIRYIKPGLKFFLTDKGIKIE